MSDEVPGHNGAKAESQDSQRAQGSIRERGESTSGTSFQASAPPDVGRGEPTFPSVTSAWDSVFAANAETTPTLEQRRVEQGRLPGTEYITFRRVHTDEFQPRGGGTFEASERVLAPRSTAGRLYFGLKQLVIGRRIPTQMQIHERLTKVKALAVLSSDAISSVAYATEASLGVLVLAGVAALGYNLLLTAAIVLLLVIVGTSYRQTIYAYPHGGGSYIVAHDNLGMFPGLVAAAALMIDYVLTVSVSVSSGIDFLISAVPRLTGLDVIMGVACVLLILLINLRGIRESGTIFATPTYLFIAAFALMIVVGVLHAALSPGGLLNAVPPVATPAQRGWTESLQPLTLFLVLTAFASGCSAMTGTEAISNGIPAFKPPESKNAARTLIAMVAILGAFFAGTSYLAWRFGIVPYAGQQPTVDHQIAATLFTGHLAWFVYVVDLTTLLILVLAANTSFADFPRLSSILARDGFLPHLFSLRGDRLAFSVGIIVLGGLSSALIVIFHGNTDALINLYALGVFVAFTLSQSGMVVHWFRLREAAGRGWRRSMAVNAVGAATTGLVAVIIGISKFDRGAWVVVLLVPVLVLMFYAIHRHYSRVAQATQVAPGATPAESPTQTALEQATTSLPPLRTAEIHHRMIIPIAHLDQPALQSLAYARSITPFVTAVHAAKDHTEADALRSQWAEWAARQAGAWERAAEQWHARRERERTSVSGNAQASGQALGRETREGQEDAEEIEAALRAGPQLVNLLLAGGSVIGELMHYIEHVRTAHPEDTVTVVVPEMAASHWWGRGIFASPRGLRLKLALYGRPGVVVANLPLFHESSGGYAQLAQPAAAADTRKSPTSTVSARGHGLRSEEIRHLVIVPIDTVNAPTLRALAYARAIRPFVTAVHVAIEADSEAEQQKVREAWGAWAEPQKPVWRHEAEEYRARTLPLDDRGRREQMAAAIERGPQLIFIESPYRALISPLVAYIDALREGNPGATISVVLPEFVPAHPWEHLLHIATAARLKLALRKRAGIVVINVPYHLGGALALPSTKTP